jgi:ATP-dependent DNA helicase RecG
MIHSAFKKPFTFTVEPGDLTLDGVDEILNELLDYTQVDHAAVTDSAIDSVQAGAIAKTLKRTDNQAVDVINAVDNAIVGAIANAIDSAVADTNKKVLELGKIPRERDFILKSLGVTNHRKNYESYMLPLVQKAWITMTIPDKPTSPKQQYLTTLKGRLVLEFLKYKTK